MAGSPASSETRTVTARCFPVKRCRRDRPLRPGPVDGAVRAQVLARGGAKRAAAVAEASAEGHNRRRRRLTMAWKRQQRRHSYLTVPASPTRGRRGFLSEHPRCPTPSGAGAWAIALGASRAERRRAPWTATRHSTQRRDAHPSAPSSRLEEDHSPWSSPHQPPDAHQQTVVAGDAQAVLYRLGIHVPDAVHDAGAGVGEGRLVGLSGHASALAPVGSGQGQDVRVLQRGGRRVPGGRARRRASRARTSARPARSAWREAARRDSGRRRPRMTSGAIGPGAEPSQ